MFQLFIIYLVIYFYMFYLFICIYLFVYITYLSRYLFRRNTIINFVTPMLIEFLRI